MIRFARLKRRSEFKRVTEARNSAGMPGLVLQACSWHEKQKSDAGAFYDARIGFTASRKVGNAVTRNRAKRRLRALVEEVMPLYAAPGRDYVVIARQSTPQREFAALRGDLIKALKRLKLWQANNC